MEKTNVMRLLDQKKIWYKSHTYEADASLTGEDIAKILGEDTKRVFKTLVTQGKSKAYYLLPKQHSQSAHTDDTGGIDLLHGTSSARFRLILSGT